MPYVALKKSRLIAVAQTLGNSSDIAHELASYL